VSENPEPTPPPTADPPEPPPRLWFPPRFSEEPAERDPFWDYGDLLVFAGFTFPCLLAASAAVSVAFRILHLHLALKTWELLATQFAFYALLSGVLALLFRVKYDRPFWLSLGWVAPRPPLLSIAAGGAGLATAILLLGILIRAPRVETPLTKMLKDPTSLLLVALFGSIVAPVCEELLFRGFLQPLLVRSMGAAAGIVVTALPFGLLHLQEYGNSWRHVLLIALSGAGFGWLRHATGSTRASATMHAAYNAFQFALLLASQALPH